MVQTQPARFDAEGLLEGRPLLVCLVVSRTLELNGVELAAVEDTLAMVGLQVVSLAGVVPERIA